MFHLALLLSVGVPQLLLNYFFDWTKAFNPRVAEGGVNFFSMLYMRLNIEWEWGGISWDSQNYLIDIYSDFLKRLSPSYLDLKENTFRMKQLNREKQRLKQSSLSFVSVKEDTQPIFGSPS